MTLSDQAILFFAPDPPDAIWQDKPQIARRLALNNTVLYIGPELYLRSLASQLQSGHWRPSDLWNSGLRKINEGLYAYRWSPWTPITGTPGLGGYAKSRRLQRWKATLKALDADHPILWLFRPNMPDIIDQLDPRLVIYHVVDEYSAYPGLTANQAARQRSLDAEMTRRADLVFCTARSLVEARRPLNPDTYYVPNAVDFRAFQQALTEPNERPPAAMSNLHRPVLGVVGSLNAKVDLTLLAEVAERRPEWSLALVGPLGYGPREHEWSRLSALPNVRWPGSVPHEQVPAVIAACDVCLIPYRLNEQTRHVNPLKLYEYLAAGKPVVATPLPELEQFPSVVRLAADTSAFITAVDWALQEAGDPYTQATRRAIASANTWDHRVAEMGELIEEALGAG